MSQQVYEININKENPTQTINQSICDNADLDFIFAQKGQRIKTIGPNKIKSHIVNENGDFVVEMETSYKTETIPIFNNNIEKFSACVDCFDDNSVTLIVSYEDHDSKRLFKKQIRNKLEKLGLLNIGTNFYIETKENEDGFNLKIIPISSSYDKVTNDLFDKFLNMQREK